jgi:ureidoglycolate lyase
MKSVIAEPVTPSAFAPFGDAFRSLTAVGRSPPVSTIESTLMTRVPPSLTVTTIARSTFPLEIRLLERHVNSTQTFIPMLNSDFLAIVTPNLPDGSPNLSELRAFLFEGNTGLTYRLGVWHASMIGISNLATFSVLMWRGEDSKDETIGVEPLQIHLPRGWVK